jgi:hypothetical protein
VFITHKYQKVRLNLIKQDKQKKLQPFYRLQKCLGRYMDLLIFESFLTLYKKSIFEAGFMSKRENEKENFKI